MLQRKQTLWLLLIVVCGLIQLLLPVVEFTQLQTLQMYQLNISGIHAITPEGDVLSEVAMSTVWLTVLAATIPALAIVIIFLYRKRIVQARLCVINIVLMIGYYALLAMYIWFAVERLQVDWYLQVAAGMELINIVLSFMALRGILKDEALVRSMNRIR